MANNQNRPILGRLAATRFYGALRFATQMSPLLNLLDNYYKPPSHRSIHQNWRISISLFVSLPACFFQLSYLSLCFCFLEMYFTVSYFTHFLSLSVCFFSFLKHYLKIERICNKVFFKKFFMSWNFHCVEYSHIKALQCDDLCENFFDSKIKFLFSTSILGFHQRWF